MFLKKIELTDHDIDLSTIIDWCYLSFLLPPPLPLPLFPYRPTECSGHYFWVEQVKADKQLNWELLLNKREALQQR